MEIAFHLPIVIQILFGEHNTQKIPFDTFKNIYKFIPYFRWNGDQLTLKALEASHQNSL